MSKADSLELGYRLICTSTPWMDLALCSSSDLASSSLASHESGSTLKMASMSASSSMARWNYDVFLSFRGEDTRKSFTDHLYAALQQRSIVVFRDDPHLERGKTIAPELQKAIEESRNAVVILSRNYASSTWCLDELVKIVQCMKSERQTVLPVFYHVDPSEVRKQTGSYQEAFDKYEEIFKNNSEKVHGWRDALKEVANLSGWHLDDQPESKFIQEIVEFISNKRRRPDVLSALKEFVGMDSRLMQLGSCMALGSNDIRFVGICGMGGIGKTTISRAYYSQVSHHFDGSAFLANVKEVSEKNGLVALQDYLLCDILRKETRKIRDVFTGMDEIKKELCKRRVLIVIDAVDHPDHLKFLAGKEDWFGAGSRIIITTRDESLVHSHGVDEDTIFIYKPVELKNDEALQLFSLKAFKKNHPPEEYVKLSTDVVRYAGGLPLALEVLGSFLVRKTMKEWKSALARMKANPERKILDTLRISFDGLEENEKKIFLDIACFFKGKDRDYVTEILDSFAFYPDIGMRSLIDKSLITILDNNTVWMHDLLQEMCWKLVRQESEQEPGKRSRIWLYADVCHVFRKTTGTEAVEGIVLELAVPSEAQLSAKALSKMSRLRLLIIQNLHFSHGLEQLSDQLRVLKWHEYPFKSLPSDFNAEELIELELCHSQIEQLWKGMQHQFDKLKVINLSHSLNLVKTPNFNGVPNLEKLILEGCTQLSEIDQSIGLLDGLTVLNLKDCRSLTSLPTSVYGIKALKNINLSGCLKLEYLLEEFGQAECLENLDISGTATRHPPPSLSLFRNLRILSLRGYSWVQSKSWISSRLPSVGGEDTNSTSSIFQSLSGLYSLKGLDLSNCSLSEDSVPSDLSSFTSLLALNLSGNDFSTLPASISRLSSLEFLYMDDCKRLRSFQGLPSTVKLVTARACSSLDILPAKPQLYSVESQESESTSCLNLTENQSNQKIDIRMTRQYVLCFAVYLLTPLFPEYLSDGDMLTVQGLFNKGPPMDMVFMGSEVPKWFNFRGLGDTISIQLPPLWQDSKWLGFALCAILVPRHGFSTICNSHLRCNMVIRRHDSSQMEGLISHTYLYENSRMLQIDHFWFFYLPRYGFLNTDWPDTCKTSCNFEARIVVLDEYFDVKECGIHLVYEGEGVEFDHQVRQFCRSNLEELKLVLHQNLGDIIPHGTVIKTSDNAPGSSGNGSFEEEPQEKRFTELN